MIFDFSSHSNVLIFITNLTKVFVLAKTSIFESNQKLLQYEQKFPFSNTLEQFSCKMSVCYKIFTF